MPEAALNRRAFLKSGGAIIVGTLAFASGPIALLAPSRSWALALVTLDQHQADTLLKFSRHIFPHKTLEDAVYALIVKDLDQAAGKDSSVKQLLVSGVMQLDDLSESDWLSQSNEVQAGQVKSLAGEPFFEKVRSTGVVSLYNNELAFAHFGYEGPSFPHGGYLQRGFDDLDWLPSPSEAASPTV